MARASSCRVRRRQFRRAVRGDQHRGAGVADVRKRKSVRDGRIQHSPAPVPACARRSRARAGGISVHCFGGMVTSGNCTYASRGRTVPAASGVDQPARLHAALEGVHVRVLLEPDDGVGMRGHAPGDVGVQVDGHHQRHAGAQHLARALDQVALHVLQVLAHHGAVQVEQDPAAAGLPPSPGEPLQQHAGEFLVRRRLDHPGRGRRTPTAAAPARSPALRRRPGSRRARCGCRGTGSGSVPERHPRPALRRSRSRPAASA